MYIRKVLFLCSGNYYRSRFAEELFNHLATNAGLNWRAASRGLALEQGTNNIGPVSVFALQALVDRGIEPPARLPLACNIEDLRSSHLVVAMKEAEHRFFLQQRFPGWENRVSYWHVHDIDVAQPAEAIVMIDDLVRDLIRDLRTSA